MTEALSKHTQSWCDKAAWPDNGHVSLKRRNVQGINTTSAQWSEMPAWLGWRWGKAHLRWAGRWDFMWEGDRKLV